MKYLDEVPRNGKIERYYRRKVPTKLIPLIGFKVWKKRLPDNKEQAELRCAVLRVEHDELIEELQNKEQAEAFLRERMEPLTDLLSYPERILHEPARERLLGHMSEVWDRQKTPDQLDKYEGNLGALQDWKKFAFVNPPDGPRQRQAFDNMLEMVEAEIDKASPGGGKDLILEVLERCISFRQHKESTARKYREHVGDLVEEVGNLPIRKVTRPMIQAHLDTLMQKGTLQPSSIQKRMSAIWSVLDFALQRDLIEVNVAYRIPVPEDKRSVDEKRYLPFTPNEVRRILDCAEDHWGKPLSGMPKGRRIAYLNITWILMFSALRPDEAMRLEPGDITDTAIHVREGKTAAARRIVPLHPVLKDRNVKRWLDSGGMETFTTTRVNAKKGEKFTTKERVPLTHSGKLSNMRQAIAGILKRVGIQDDRKAMYSCRSTFSNALRRVDAPDKIKSALLGHTEGGTLAHYTDGPQFDDLREWVEAADPRQ